MRGAPLVRALCAACVLASAHAWRAPELGAGRCPGAPFHTAREPVVARAMAAPAAAPRVARAAGVCVHASAALEPPPPTPVPLSSALRADVRDILLIALPALGTCLMPPLGNLVDAWALGRLTPGGDLFASTALAALEANSAIFGFAEGSFAFVAVAMTRVLGAQAVAGDLAQARAARAGIVLSLCAGAGVSLLLLVRRDVLLSRFFGLAGVPGLLAPARAYLALRALALPAAVASCAAGGACVALRAVSKRAYALPLAAHALLSALLVPLGAGLRGVACASVVAAWLQLWLLARHIGRRLPATRRLRWWPEASQLGARARRSGAAAGAPSADALASAAAPAARAQEEMGASSEHPLHRGRLAAGQLRAWLSVSGRRRAAARQSLPAPPLPPLPPLLSPPPLPCPLRAALR